MAWTQADVDQLRAAILALASGEAVVSVSYNGPPARMIQYHQRDLAEMRDLLASMQVEVSAASGTPRVRYAKTSKGF